MTEEFKITEFYDHLEVTKILNDYDADISIDLMQQPGYFSRYSYLLARAESQYDRIKAMADIVEARLDAKYRDLAAKSGAKTTEGVIKAQIQRDPQTERVQRLLIKAREQVGCLKGTCEALRQRRDTLLQMAYNSRAEQQGPPTVMSKQHNKDTYGERIKRFKQTLEKDQVDW